MISKNLFLRLLSGIREGSLELTCEDGATLRLGQPSETPSAQLAIHHARFYWRALRGDVALGESYMDGDWSSPDPVAIIRLAVRNLALFEQSGTFLAKLRQALGKLSYRRNDASVAASRRNIQAHYDLSNDFFRLFLDRSMMYSCAWFDSPDDSLERAQIQKLDRICRKLALGPGDHVLEIGTGWGAFALHAVRNYGCRVTTTTISDQQFQYARALFASASEGNRIELLLEDYRHLRGQYDKIVSIEMFEAVGYDNYDTFFGCCDRLLKRDGSLLLQTITMNDQNFPGYRRKADWIQKYIFPGSELASLTGILRSLGRATRLSLFHAEDMGAHYARTLAEWRARFNASLDQVRALGFDQRFIRMWDFYFAYCEGAFLERHISDFQLMLTKTHNRQALIGEPWLSDQAPTPRFHVAGQH